MSQSVFLSHAGADSAPAMVVAAALREAGLKVRLDRAEVALGDSFLGFMESALAGSDYCLLLWSPHAAATPWVGLEWESALYRTVTEKRAFLVVGRLQDVPLPALLRPRLFTDLFPRLQPGLGRIVDAWRADRAAEQQSQRPVAQARAGAAAEAGPDTVYVSSELFGIAVPWPVDLALPALALQATLLQHFKLPAQLDHEGRLGLRISYRLRLHNAAEPLDGASSLAAQGVVTNALVWLEATVTPFAAVAALPGTAADAGAATYRGAEAVPAGLLRAVSRAGLGTV